MPSAIVCSDIDAVIRFIALWDNNAAIAACLSLTIGLVPFYPLNRALEAFRTGLFIGGLHDFL